MLSGRQACLLGEGAGKGAGKGQSEVSPSRQSVVLYASVACLLSKRFSFQTSSLQENKQGPREWFYYYRWEEKCCVLFFFLLTGREERGNQPNLMFAGGVPKRGRQANHKWACMEVQFSKSEVESVPQTGR